MPLVTDAMLEEVARRFSLLGDPMRLRLVRALHENGPTSVQDLADIAGSTTSNASQHLNRLLLGGIVGRRRQGKSVIYSIDDPSIDALCSIVCDSIQDRARKLSA